MSPKTRQNIAISIIIIVLSLILTSTTSFSWRQQTKGSFNHVKGLHGSVTIVRNQHGLVRITAKDSDLDAFFALGFVHAQDRLWQMIYQKHVAMGTLSEIFGAATIPQDKYLRTWGFYRAAKAAWPSLSAHTKAVVRAYTAGVNYEIKTGHLPLQMRLLNYRPQPWTVYDSIAWQKMMAWDLQSTWTQKVRDYLIEQKYGFNAISYYFPPYPKGAPLILSDRDLQQSGIRLKPAVEHQHLIVGKYYGPLQLSQKPTFTDQIKRELNFRNAPGKGSNSWVVASSRTVDGLPMMANDLHLDLQAPNKFFEVHLIGPTLNVVGGTLPGLPGIVIGHNQSITWGVTNGEDDSEDLYLLPKNTKYKVIHDVIHVRGGKDMPITIRISKWGPVISDVTPQLSVFKQPVALKWTALMPNDTSVQAFLKINYAKNWKDFTAALKDFITPTQNFIYADKQGNIGYYYAGRIPIRKGWTGALPVCTNKEWSGYIPFDQLPHVFNPTEGQIITANNKVVSDRYPYLLNFYWHLPPYRAERIHALIDNKAQFSRTDFERIQNDVYSVYWSKVRDVLLKVKPLDDNSRLVLKVLRRWDGVADRQTYGETAFAMWQQQFDYFVPKSVRFGEKWDNPVFMIKILKDSKNQQYLSESLKIAAAQIVRRFGTDHTRWYWDRAHISNFDMVGIGQVPLLRWIWNRQIPTTGTNFTVNVGTYDPKSLQQISGPVFRDVIPLGNLSSSQFMMPMGQTDDLFATGYDDMLPMWANGQYLYMSFVDQAAHIKELDLNP